MGKAEVGSTKYLSNRMKAKGLQRLRWYCQPCERQMRDENAFKQHCMSESHVRQMLLVGEDPKKFLREYSDQFLKDFMSLLKTGHQDKMVQINHFYQEYIANKEHVHMNSTQWSSLTEFAKYLGKEGICRVEENEKGIHIAWIDNSPEALRRQDALRRKAAQDRGDEEWEQRMLKEQIRRAQKDAAARDASKEDEADARPAASSGVQVQSSDKITFSFGGGAKKPVATQPPQDQKKQAEDAQPDSEDPPAEASAGADGEATTTTTAATAEPSKPTTSVSLKFGAKPPPKKNVFAEARKNALAAGGGAKKIKIEQPKKMSEAERIMREELERKRSREFSNASGSSSGSSNKRTRF